MKKIIVCAALLAIVLTAGPALAEQITAFVSILPQKYFVDQIADGKVQVEVMVQPGAAPHVYEPKPSQMVKLSKAAVYFAIGGAFEKAWQPRFMAANKNLLVVQTDEQVKKRAMAAHRHEEEHGKVEDSDHDREGLDPHIWTAPLPVMIQVRAILNGLLQVDPANKEHYMKNYERFIDSLAALDMEIMTIIGTEKEGRDFLVFHPAWGYFADAYGLKEIAIEVEGKEPKPAELQELIKESREMGVKAVFVQPQLSRRSADTIAQAIGAKVVVADPLAANWAENLKRVASEFSQALR